MDKRGIGLIDLRDPVRALGLLTRLPLPVAGHSAIERGAAAAWAYPLAGMVIGAIVSVAVAIALWLGISPGITAAVALVVSVMLTGAMHEDGLADSADGLWGGWDPARRLAIMKDSHIGTYGVIALVLGMLIRWLALIAVISADAYWAVLIGTGAVSRAGMVVLMGAMRHARADGLSHHVGHPDARTVWVGIGIAGFAGFMTLGFGPSLTAVVAVTICGLIARAKIGGQTGDILGATQQVTEMVILIAVASTLA